jgi:hypothetical protein
MTREHILGEIRRTAVENGGVPLGRTKFYTATGIKQSDWYGIHWARWGDAVREAGFQANSLTEAFTEEQLIQQLVALARELGRFPLHADIRMKHRQDAAFPGHDAFRKLGPLRRITTRMSEYCAALPGHEDVVAMCAAAASRGRLDAGEAEAAPGKKREDSFGSVYLLRVGRHYKLGRSNAFGRRERELAIQLPDKAHTVHVIKTDDPAGIEEYWHKRFAAKRGNGEWFALEPDDVSAFRRRKFM